MQPAIEAVIRRFAAAVTADDTGLNAKQKALAMQAAVASAAGRTRSPMTRSIEKMATREDGNDQQDQVMTPVLVAAIRRAAAEAAATATGFDPKEMAQREDAKTKAEAFRSSGGESTEQLRTEAVRAQAARIASNAAVLDDVRQGHQIEVGSEVAGAAKQQAALVAEEFTGEWQRLNSPCASASDEALNIRASNAIMNGNSTVKTVKMCQDVCTSSQQCNAIEWRGNDKRKCHVILGEPAAARGRGSGNPKHGVCYIRVRGGAATQSAVEEAATALAEALANDIVRATKKEEEQTESKKLRQAKAPSITTEAQQRAYLDDETSAAMQGFDTDGVVVRNPHVVASQQAQKAIAANDIPAAAAAARSGGLSKDTLTKLVTDVAAREAAEVVVTATEAKSALKEAMSAPVRESV